MFLKLTALGVIATSLVFSGFALASCEIANETKWDFTVESGNTSNQSVSAHSRSSIHSGKIVGIDKKAGKSISGHCKDGDKLVVKDDGGVPVMQAK